MVMTVILWVAIPMMKLEITLPTMFRTMVPEMMVMIVAIHVDNEQYLPTHKHTHTHTKEIPLNIEIE